MSTILTVDEDPRFRMQACDALGTDGFVVVGKAVDGASDLGASDDRRRVPAVLAHLRRTG